MDTTSQRCFIKKPGRRALVLGFFLRKRGCCLVSAVVLTIKTKKSGGDRYGSGRGIECAALSESYEKRERRWRSL